MRIRSRGFIKLFHDGLMVSLGQIGAALGALVSIRIFTEILEPKVFGSVTLVIGMVMFCEGLAVNPVMQAILRYYASYSRTDELCILRTESIQFLKTTTLILLVAAILSSAGYGFLERDLSYIPIGVLVGILLVADASICTELAFFNAANRQSSLAIWKTIDACARQILAWVCVVLFGATVHSALAGYVVGAVIVLIMITTVSTREATNHKSESHLERSHDVRRALITYAMPIMPLAIVSWLSNWSDRYVIGALLSLEDVGVYSAAYGIASRSISMLCGAIDTAIRPRYFNAVASGNEGREQEIFSMWIAAVCVAVTMVVCCFYLFSGTIARLLVAERYQGGAWLMPWVAAGYSLLGVSQVFAASYYAKLRTRLVLLVESVGAATKVIVAYPAILFVGLFGAAISVPVAFGVQLVTSIIVWRSISHSSAEPLLAESSQASVNCLKS